MYTLSLALILLSFGCDQGTDITFSVSSSDQQEINWITLPSPEGLSSETSLSFTVSKIIDGKKGGEIRLEGKYDSPFGKIEIDAILEFPKKSFQGSKEITMTCFPEEGTVMFEPSMEFDKKLKFTLEYKGIDLTAVNEDDVMFSYIDVDGTLVETKNSDIDIDFHRKKIKVSKAKLTHFSRYGFVNRQ
jgi:hypothetical protein